MLNSSDPSTVTPGSTSNVRIAIAVVVVAALIGAGILGLSYLRTNSTTSCSGLPPGGDCVGPYSYTFTLSVNYTGPWKLSYQGYNSMGESNPIAVSDNSSGSNFYSKAITLSGLNNNGLTLCATAQKLDGSNSTLRLTVTGYNETSLPYGSTSYCGTRVP